MACTTPDDDNVDEDDICSLRVNGGHAIAFTNELFHADGGNNTAKFNYHLFAYIVSNEEDYPNNQVFTKTKGNMEKLNAAREKAEGGKQRYNPKCIIVCNYYVSII